MTTETATPEALEPETVEPAGAETTEASVETTPAPGELILARGVGIDIWRDTASTFVPILKSDMPMEQRRAEAVLQRAGAAGRWRRRAWVRGHGQPASNCRSTNGRMPPCL